MSSYKFCVFVCVGTKIKNLLDAPMSPRFEPVIKKKEKPKPKNSRGILQIRFRIIRQVCNTITPPLNKQTCFRATPVTILKALAHKEEKNPLGQSRTL